MKNKIILLVMFICVMLAQICYANDEIMADVTRDGRNITVLGKIQNASEPQIVFLVIGTPDNVLVSQQTVSDEAGNFVFDMVMPENAEFTNYSYTLSTAVFEGVLNYSKPEMVAEIIVDGRNVTISGGLEGMKQQHTATLVIGNIDNVLYAKQITSDADGNFVFDAVLPDNTETGEYSYMVSSTAEVDSLSGIVRYERSGIVAQTDVNGNIVTVSGVVYNTQSPCGVSLLIGDINNVYYAKQVMTDANGRFVFNAVMPEIAQTGDYNYTVTSSNGFSANNTFKYIQQSYSTSLVHTGAYDVAPERKLPYFIKTDSVPDLSNKKIVVTYPADMLKLIDACMFTSEMETYPVNLKDLGINILSVTDGKIEIEVSDDYIDFGKLKIIVSAVGFEGITTGTANITCTVVDK